MAGGVSVEKAAVKSGVAVCKTSMQELDDAAKRLQSFYRQAGEGGWRDSQYASLGGIVEDCCSTLRKPVSELQDCKAKLEDLLAAIADYEEVSI